MIAGCGVRSGLMRTVRKMTQRFLGAAVFKTDPLLKVASAPLNSQLNFTG